MRSKRVAGWDVSIGTPKRTPNRTLAVDKNFPPKRAVALWTSAKYIRVWLEVRILQRAELAGPRRKLLLINSDGSLRSLTYLLRRPGNRVATMGIATMRSEYRLRPDAVDPCLRTIWTSSMKQRQQRFTASLRDSSRINS